MDRLTILKVGGSCITDKHSKTPKVDHRNLVRIAKEIATGLKAKPQRLLLVHGVGSYGHQIVNRTGIHKGINKPQQLIDFAETQRLQNELNILVTKELIKEGVPAIPMQASSHAILKNGHVASMEKEVVRGMLDMGLVPVMYGVPAYDTEQKCSILSGDQIVAYYARELKAKRIIHATNVDGVFTDNPHKNPNAELIPEINEENFKHVEKALGCSDAVDVTGGMEGKIRKLRELLKGGRTHIIVINALKPANIEKTLKGEEIKGTIIKF